MTTPICGYLLQAAGKQIVAPIATCTARVCVNAAWHIVEFVVLPSCSHAVILGWDFLSAADAVIDCGRFLPDLSETVEPVPLPFLSHKLSCEEDASLPPCASVFLSVSAPDCIDTDVLISPSKTKVRKNICRNNPSMN